MSNNTTYPSDIRSFSEFASEPEPLEGTKMRLDDILNRQIVITAYDIKSSRYTKNKSGKYLTLQFYMVGDPPDQLHIIFTGSDVLIDQLERYASYMPFRTTIKKINRYYTLS